MANCRVPSSEASKRTLKRRSEDISRVRSISSGGDTTTQMAAEFHCLPKEERAQILLDAGLPITIPTDIALGMKADLFISWNQLRRLRKLHKTSVNVDNSYLCT